MDDPQTMTPEQRRAVTISEVRPIIGLEVHVELATASKMFGRARNPAAPLARRESPDGMERAAADAAPNTLLDPVVLALPGSLPTPNARAIELAARVGLALRCEVADVTRFDRKSYFYPDLPKAYQISQYDRPLCFDGAVDVPPFNDRGEPLLDEPRRRVGIIRAHLEEDAGKLLHEAPGGAAIGHSIVDLNRAGAPLLEIVTQPDFIDADGAVAFCRLLRATIRLLGASDCVMQRGQMRLEPNINCRLTLEGGRTVTTPIVEVKNLNSLRALRGAIEHELATQPQRWREDGRIMGPGAKRTFGWDDSALRTVPQRDKEDAHDYRYFPDPDLPPVRVPPEAMDRARDRAAEPWLARVERLTNALGLPLPEAVTLLGDGATADLFERSHARLLEAGVGAEDAARALANAMTQKAASLANQAGCDIGRLGLTPEHLADLVALRLAGDITSNAADELLEALAADPLRDARSLAADTGLLVVRDAAAIAQWCRAAIEANPKAADEVRAGKHQAVGRLIGEAMRHAAGAGDPKAIREKLLEMLGEEHPGG